MRIWFMYDCHAFAQLKDLSRDVLAARARELFAEDGCGTLFVRDEYGGDLGSLTLHGRRQADGKYGISDNELHKWLDEVDAERSFRTLMV